MVKIKCKTSYISRFKDNPIAFAADFEGEVTSDIAEFLSRDAPENFDFPEGFAVEEKSPDSPEVDKMVGEPLEKKSIKELKAMLKEKGLPVGGRKKILIDRLTGAGR